MTWRSSGGHLAPQRFGRTLDVLRIHGDSGQLVQQVAAFRKAAHRGDTPHHARHRRRERRRLDPQGVVSRTEASLARGAVVVGARKGDGAKHGGQRLGSSTRIASELVARAGPPRPHMVGGIGIEPLLDHSCRNRETPSPDCRLDRFKVEAIDGL